MPPRTRALAKVESDACLESLHVSMVTVQHDPFIQSGKPTPAGGRAGSSPSEEHPFTHRGVVKRVYAGKHQLLLHNLLHRRHAPKSALYNQQPRNDHTISNYNNRVDVAKSNKYNNLTFSKKCVLVSGLKRTIKVQVCLYVINI